MQQVTTANRPAPPDREPLSELARAIEHATHLLPAQGPITAFVHHNTLHAFEDLPFEQAVVQGGRTLGCHPYLSEDQYRQELARGRIQAEDIEAVLIDDLGDRGDELLGFLGTRFHLREGMLRSALRTGPTAELRWVVEETDALRVFHADSPADQRDRIVRETRHWVMRDLRNGTPASACEPRIRALVEQVLDRFDRSQVEHWDDATWQSFTLHVLWFVCRDGVSHVGEHSPFKATSVRHRDCLLEATGEDSDELVHDVLIRFCAAFLDQGFADWPLPQRDAGLFQSFAALYRRRGGPPLRWIRGLRAEMDRLDDEGITPLESVSESLELLGVVPDEQQEFITQTLLALRGYAGMIWQMETRSDRVAHAIPTSSLIEFLAVHLILDRFALAHVAKESLAFAGPLPGLRSIARQHAPAHPPVSVEQRAFVVFQLAQVLGWSPESLARLSPTEWATVVEEIEAFSGLERRRILHMAFERRYRVKTLDAVAVHSRRIKERHDRCSGKGVPSFQVICCIDEREESFRRHLEEVAPDCETLGAAGFFAVAMYYRGAADAHYTPLCPVTIKPTHYVAESVAYTLEETERRRRNRRRTVGTVTHQMHVGSRTFAGGWLAAVLGSVSSIPLVARILFPRATAQFRRIVGGFVRTPAATHLQLQRTEDNPGPKAGYVGYSVEEMAAIVERLLRDMGLTERLSRLVVVCGHGSSSLNNPHEAAHDCGACGGGRGGPNARAFAQMANDPLVRRIIADHGLSIPQETVFVGAYHDTCDDNLTFYDLDRLPDTHKADFELARMALDAARERSAHERCRRFDTAELRLTPCAALRHVESRAEDLSQVRPEYGHATNALCFVGRREWSRGLFLDRRAFLQSYDPAQDEDDHSILTRILQAVVPVCAGINLEYYFSYVDPTGYGCGTKLPHNITSLLGVMNGAASDLRPGLPWQMVEVHEPVRLLFVIEATPEAMLRIMDANEGIAKLVRGGWVQLATLDPTTSEISVFRKGRFEPYQPLDEDLPVVDSSIDWYRGWRDHLGFASVNAPRIQEWETQELDTHATRIMP